MMKMRKYLLSALMLTAAVCLGACGGKSDRFKGIDTQEEIEALFDEAVAANNYSEIFKEYKSVDTNETQVANDNTKLYEYRSENLMFIHGDDMTKGFQYESFDKSVVLDLNVEVPWHSCPLDAATFEEAQKNYFDCFKNVAFPDYYDDYEVSITDGNTFVLENDNDVYTFTCDPKTLLVTKETYRFAGDDKLYLSREFTYNEVDKDLEHTSWVEGYIKGVSANESVHIKVNGIDGKVYEGDCPKGFVARIYTPGGDYYKYAGSDEYYSGYGDVLMDDVELDEVSE